MAALHSSSTDPDVDTVVLYDSNSWRVMAANWNPVKEHQRTHTGEDVSKLWS